MQFSETKLTSFSARKPDMLQPTPKRPYEQLQQQTRELDALSVSRDLEYVKRLLKEAVVDQTRLKPYRVLLPAYITIDLEDTEVLQRCVRFTVRIADEDFRVACRLERDGRTWTSWQVEEEVG
jgi:hypothetical protein